MKKAILMGVPHHNNMGDHAITIAERQYIQDNFKEYTYYEISEETIERCVYKVKNHVENQDIIFFHGGGNLGNQYLYIEEGRRKVIKLFPDNKIIMFPQTMYFTNDEEGKRELEKSKKIYSNHKNLILIAREKVSYEMMKREFQNNTVLCTPDIVTYLNKTEEKCVRKGLLVILRSDIEANLEDDEIKEIDSIARKYFDKIEYDDTAKGDNILEKDRETKFEQLLQKYRENQLVVTDRLHGMIFAAITSTPCIALGNYNHKIEACSKTLESLGYIRYAKNLDEIEEQIQFLLNTKFEPYNNNFAIEQFKQIKMEGEWC